MKSVLVSFLAAVAIAVALPSFGRADASLECSIVSGSQVETGKCVGDMLASVDKAVDVALSFAMEAAKGLDNTTGRSVAVPALEKAQTSWSDYRNQHCEFVGATFGGGSGTGIAIDSCRVELGRARVKELMLFSQ